MIIQRKHILVSGSVQGVGFRYFTYNRAQKYQISGWVRNLEDGRVETLAVGETKQIEQFIEDLKKGPSSSYVSDVKIENIDYDDQKKENNETEEFIIKKNGLKPWEQEKL